MRKALHILSLVLILSAFGAAAMADDAPAGNGVVNINTATASQLAMLPGVGASSAQRIVEYRTEHGPFKKAADLLQVKGVGAKTFERLSSYVSVDGATTLKAKVSSPRKPRAKKPSSTAS